MKTKSPINSQKKSVRKRIWIWDSDVVRKGFNLFARGGITGTKEQHNQPIFTSLFSDLLYFCRHHLRTSTPQACERRTLSLWILQRKQCTLGTWAEHVHRHSTHSLCYCVPVWKGHLQNPPVKPSHHVNTFLIIPTYLCGYYLSPL